MGPDATNELMAAYACPDYWRVKYFDPELEEVMNRFRGGNNRYAEVFDWSRDERFWIINTESDTEGLTWYLYDKETKRERILFRSEFASYQDRMAPMQPIKDGVTPYLRFYRALESFLAAHLGGRVSPITADEMWIGLQ